MSLFYHFVKKRSLSYGCRHAQVAQQFQGPKAPLTSLSVLCHTETGSSIDSMLGLVVPHLLENPCHDLMRVCHQTMLPFVRATYRARSFFGGVQITFLTCILLCRKMTGVSDK